MEKKLPREVLYREKMGFAVPLAKWFRGPLKQRVSRQLLSGPLGDTGLFDVGFISKLLDAHVSGLSDHSTAIWSLLMFDAFLRRSEGLGEPERSWQSSEAAAS
jgi:asparagine synthase (glutamine-hydrolysing)